MSLAEPDLEPVTGDGGLPVLSVRGLVTRFTLRKPLFRPPVRITAVDGVAFDLTPGKTLGLVGESGSGKSTVARSVLRLVEPDAGEVVYRGRNLASLSPGELRATRRDLQMVFQDPFASLDPRMTIATSLKQPMITHDLPGSHDDLVDDLLDRVGLSTEHRNRFPHEFSGGQRQRVCIARAIALRPSVLVLDEPVSALDVSIQAGVLNLLDDLQREFALSYLFIAHDLAVVYYVAHEIAVMYLGRIVEQGSRAQIFSSPAHPYTQALLSAIPVADPRRQRNRDRIVLKGEIPSPATPPSGCRFRTRCWKADDHCATTAPELVELAPGHRAACHYPEPTAVEVTPPVPRDDVWARHIDASVTDGGARP